MRHGQDNQKPILLDLLNGITTSPCLNNRPERDTVISADEITNLVITLNTTHSVDEFLEVV